MIEFNVPAMSCGHCITAVTEAIHTVDPAARVEVNLDSKSVKVESTQDKAKLSQALVEAGYEPA